MKWRRSTILKYANEVGCTAAAAFEPENVFYLTGFWGEAIAITAENGTKLVTPKLEYARAEKMSTDCEVIPTERGAELISTFVSQIRKNKVCTDCSDYLTV